MSSAVILTLNFTQLMTFTQEQTYLPAQVAVLAKLVIDNKSFLDESHWDGTGRFVFTSQEFGYENVQTCPESQALLNATFWAEDWNKNASEGMDILGMLEKEFECAGMCQDPPSLFYTFSELAKYNRI